MMGKPDMVRRRWRMLTALLLLLLLAGCGTHGAAQGGANDSGAGGRVKIGLPF